MRKSLTSLFVIVAILALSAPVFAATEAAPEKAAPAGVININTADASQFALLPRVGPKAAERIIEFRKSNGGFKKTTDLMQVKGIGDKTFQTLSPYLVLEGKTTLSSKQHAGSRKPRAKSQKSSESTVAAQ